MNLALAVPGTLEQAEAFMRQNGVDKERPQIVAALNAAAVFMESAKGTGRRLVERTYRDPVTVADCTTTSNSKNVTSSAGFGNVKRGDPVAGAGIQPGTFVRTWTSASAIELSQAATATASDASLTFGSAPLVVSGTGASTIYIPERPVSEVYGARWVGADGTETDFDLTGARILDAEVGLYRLASGEAFPRGVSNIEIDCRAGYREPTATDLGHEDWHLLQRLCHRLAQCYFQDQQNALGRVADKTLGQASFRFVDFDLPLDVKQGLEHFRRREGV